MLRGYYTAAAGVMAQQTRLNAIANNIANVSTAGYKRDDVTLSTFGEHIAVRMNTYEINELHRHGKGVFMQVTDEKHTNFSQGDFDATGRTLDMCIQGEGFFVVNTPDGERLTRDGQFALDQDGYLVLPGFGRVRGDSGDIQIGTSYFTVTENGSIYVEPEEEGDEPQLIARLRLAIPGDYEALEKEPSGLYRAESFTLAPETSGDTVVLHQVVERSNVDMSQEMTHMLAAQRSLQGASQIIKMYDQMSEESINRISRM